MVALAARAAVDGVDDFRGWPEIDAAAATRHSIDAARTIGVAVRRGAMEGRTPY
jgi:hypothetical protein